MSGETFERLDLQWDFVKPWGTTFPFAVKSKRPLSARELSLLEDYCNDAFGPGGTLPIPDQRWACQRSVERFGFRSEADRALFVLAHTGAGPAVH